MPGAKQIGVIAIVAIIALAIAFRIPMARRLILPAAA